MNALRANQQIGQFLNLPRPSAHNEDLQAGMVIEMGMCCCDHQVVVIVLQFRQLIGQESGVMVVNQRDASDDVCIRVLQLCTDETIAYQVPKGFGTISVTALLDQAV